MSASKMSKTKSTQMISKGLETLNRVITGDSDEPGQMFMEAEARWERLQQRNQQIQRQLEEIRASTRQRLAKSNQWKKKGSL